MYVTLQLNGSPKKKKALERPSRMHQEECEETAGQVRVRLSRTCEQSRKAQPGFPPLVNCARQDQGLVLLRWSSCFSEYQRQTIYKSWLGPHRKLYLIGLLPMVLNHIQLLSFWQHKRKECAYVQLTLKASLKMTGGNVRQLLEGDCVTPKLQYTILLLLGTVTTTSMASRN